MMDAVVSAVGTRISDPRSCDDTPPPPPVKVLLNACVNNTREPSSIERNNTDEIDPGMDGTEPGKRPRRPPRDDVLTMPRMSSLSNPSDRVT
jgi:hypothetical protein